MELVLKILFNVITAKCPIPERAPQPTIDGDEPNIDFVLASNTSTDEAIAFSDFWNDTANEPQRLFPDSVAKPNLESVEIKFPLPQYNGVCNTNFTVCIYNRELVDGVYKYTAADPAQVAEFKRTNSIICCLPNLACCTPEEEEKGNPVDITI